MKNEFIFFCLLITSLVYAQKDSLDIGDKYTEDQFYIGITYNVLYHQPSQVGSSSFSYGLSLGYIKDIPFNKSGKFATGIGIGYAYDSFNHGLNIVNNKGKFTFDTGNNSSLNRLKLHSIVFPLEIRWRTATAIKYNFWRIYTGITLSYNFSNTFSYVNSGKAFSFNNIPAYNKWQYGLTLSAGYATFNFYLCYGLTPILKNSSLKDKPIDTKIIKLGLIFYLL